MPSKELEQLISWFHLLIAETFFVIFFFYYNCDLCNNVRVILIKIMSFKLRFKRFTMKCIIQKHFLRF